MYTWTTGEQVLPEELNSLNDFLHGCGVECGLPALCPGEKAIIKKVTTNHHPRLKKPESITAVGILTCKGGGFKTEVVIWSDLPCEMKRCISINVTSELVAAHLA